MLSGPIYETGSIGWAKGGHGLAHTDLIFRYHRRDLLLAQNGARWDYTLVDIPPKSYQQSPGQCHDAYSSSSFTAISESLLKPKTELTLWLESKPAPCDLNRHRAYSGIAGLVDSLLSIHRSTIEWSRCQTSQ